MSQLESSVPTDDEIVRRPDIYNPMQVRNATDRLSERVHTTEPEPNEEKVSSRVNTSAEESQTTNSNEAKPFVGPIMEDVLKVRWAYMTEFIISPFIGSGVETVEGETTQSRRITIYVNRALSAPEEQDGLLLDNIPVRYIADGIDVTPKI